MKKLVCICLFAVAFSLLSATTSCMAKDETNLSAWLVYWDMNKGTDELIKSGDTYDEISLFAGYFNEKGKLFVPENLQVNKAQAKNWQQFSTRYLTVVNDVQMKDKTSFKDIEIVKKVLANPKLQAKHADEIIALAKKYDCNGIDLDYERVFRDSQASKLYVDFIQVLADKAKANKLKLRVILEPNVDFKAYKFPEYPRYMVMMYNLYGTHSEKAGAKADFVFIKNTLNKMQALPENRGVAFATGGCYWNDKGERKFISSDEAVKLARKYKQIPKRSFDSNALNFSYEEDNVKYTVWYADKMTLYSWISRAQAAGINDVAIWRLGSNDAAYKF